MPHPQHWTAHSEELAWVEEEVTDWTAGPLSDQAGLVKSTFLYLQ